MPAEISPPDAHELVQKLRKLARFCKERPWDNGTTVGEAWEIVSDERLRSYPGYMDRKVIQSVDSDIFISNVRHMEQGIREKLARVGQLV